MIMIIPLPQNPYTHASTSLHRRYVYVWVGKLCFSDYIHRVVMMRKVNNKVIFYGYMAVMSYTNFLGGRGVPVMLWTVSFLKGFTQLRFSSHLFLLLQLPFSMFPSFLLSLLSMAFSLVLQGLLGPGQPLFFFFISYSKLYPFLRLNGSSLHRMKCKLV